MDEGIINPAIECRNIRAKISSLILHNWEMYESFRKDAYTIPSIEARETRDLQMDSLVRARDALRGAMLLVEIAEGEYTKVSHLEEQIQ